MSQSIDINLSDLKPESFVLGDRIGGWFGKLAAVGVVAIVVAFALGMAGDQATESRFLHAYLTAYMYVASITLGALFFVLIMQVTSAGWCATVRRIAELVTSAFPLLAILGLPLVAAVWMGKAELFPWSDTHASFIPAGAAHLFEKKSGYLNPTFFTIRYVLYFAVWIGMANWFRNRSLEQDRTGDPKLTNSMKKVAAPMIPIFALTLSFFALDLLMSLDPAWYSTIFGVYYFAGGFGCFMALLGILAKRFGETGILKGFVRDEHYHDIGKLAFAFVMFWGYIAFSQYILIWYANIPEETLWYKEREGMFWGQVGLLFLLRFLVPFCGLLSRHTKRAPGRLVIFGGWIMVMHFFDMIFLAMPSHLNTLHYLGSEPGVSAADAEHFHHLAQSFAGFPIGIFELLTALGVFCLFAAVLVRAFASNSLLAVRDPRLSESMTFHNP